MSAADAPLPRRRVCFVVLGAYRLFQPDAGQPYGGVEVRLWLLATGLAARPDYEVHVVVYDYGQPSPQVLQGCIVHAHPAYRKHWTPRIVRYRTRLKAAITTRRPYAALPLHLGYFAASRALFTARARWQRWRHRAAPIQIEAKTLPGEQTALYDALQADVMVIAGLGEMNAAVVHWARAQQCKTLLFLMSDEDVNPVYASPIDQRDWLNGSTRLGLYTLTHSHQIIAQTDNQARWLAERFGRQGVVMRNPIRLDNAPLPLEERTFVLWVGRANAVKRPQLFIELARRLPAVPFVMVMNPGDSTLYNAVVRDLPPNITFYDYVAYQEIDRLFAVAQIFVSTSETEGMPNTFLQAGKWAVPLLSLRVDPDAMVTRGGMGRCAQDDFEQLVRDTRDLLAAPALRAKYGTASRAYVEQHFGLTGRIEELAVHIERLLADA